MIGQVKEVQFGEAMVLAAEVYIQLADVCERIEIVGSVHKRQAVIGEIELLVIPAHVGAFCKRLEEVFKGGTYTDGYEFTTVYEGVRFSVTRAAPECWDASLNSGRNAS